MTNRRPAVRHRGAHAHRWRRAALAVVAAGVAMLVAGASVAASGQPTVREASPGAFPDRAYILTLPKRQAITTASVAVTENGEPVDSLSVVPAGEQPGTSATMLVLDASNSMRGKPIKAALEAARAFVARKPRFARVGVVVFNKRVSVVVPPTTSRRDIVTALARPPALAEGTRIYDALSIAGEQLRAAQAKLPSIVLLSDGRDVGSTAARAPVVSALASERVRLFAVGLRSNQFTPKPLRQASAATGGTYAEARTTADIRPLFEDLGFRLGNEYLVLYRSLEKPEVDVSVAMRVAGYAAPLKASYVTPALATSIGREKSAWDSFVQSAFALVALVALVVALLGYTISKLLSLRKTSFRRRMAAFVRLGDGAEAEAVAEQRRDDVRKLLADADKSFKRRPLFRSFAEDCELADVDVSPAALALFAVVGGVLLGLILALGFGSPVAFLAGAAVPIGVRLAVSSRVDRKRRMFSEQLPDNLDVLAQSLRAGHSLAGALAVVAKSADEPSASEFARVTRDEQLGVVLEDALGTCVRRMDSADLDQVALVALLQRDTGGNAAEVIDQVAINIRTRMELRRLARTLTAQGRMARWILTILPVGVFAILLLVNTEYLRPLWETTYGILAMVTAAIMVFVGSQLIKRIVNIKV